MISFEGGASELGTGCEILFFRGLSGLELVVQRDGRSVGTFASGFRR